MKNYFIIHGSFSSSYSNWIGWLHDFIEGDGKQVYVPDFPIGVGYQNYEIWSKLLKYYLSLGFINENTTIIGHSIAPVFISNNDSYVNYESEKEFADKIATEQVFIPNAGHINSESGYDTFEEIVSYL